MDRVAATEFHKTDGVRDWRVLDAGACAWFDAPSMVAGAALVRRIAELTAATGRPDVDLRPGGVRVRIGPELTAAGVDAARSISAAAQELGLAADPTALQSMRLVVETADVPALVPFWQAVLAYGPDGSDRLVDPSRRDPALSFRPGSPGESRDRIHVDVVRAPDAVEATRAAVGPEPSGPYGLRLVDPDGNEVDLVPGDRISAGPEVDDWQALFAAMAFYPVESPELMGEFVTTVAVLADVSGLPVMVDVRPDGVTLDGGKDLWQDETGAARTEFLLMAAQIQAAARDFGLPADPTRPRFVQFGIDAVDVPAVRAFWTAVLGYRLDEREFVSDIYDPRRLNPVLFFQPTDASDAPRRQHRNRVHLALSVPYDQAQARVDAGLAAGGRIATDGDGDRRTLVDPEGNELDLVMAP